jgi:hypothetical protein
MTSHGVAERLGGKRVLKRHVENDFDLDVLDGHDPSLAEAVGLALSAVA